MPTPTRTSRGKWIFISIALAVLLLPALAAFQPKQYRYQNRVADRVSFEGACNGHFKNLAYYGRATCTIAGPESRTLIITNHRADQDFCRDLTASATLMDAIDRIGFEHVYVTNGRDFNVGWDKPSARFLAVRPAEVFSH